MTKSDWVLHSHWREDGSETGKMCLSLHSEAGLTLPDAFCLAFTSITRIPPETKIENAEFVRRVANYHELRPLSEAIGRERWDCVIPRLSHKPNHITDGPKSAFLILPDGSTEQVECAPFLPEISDEGGIGSKSVFTEATLPQDSSEPQLGLLPMANQVKVESWRKTAPKGLHLEDAHLCRKINDLIMRLSLSDAALFDPHEGEIELEIKQDTRLASEAYEIDFQPAIIALRFGDEAGLLYSLIALSQIMLAARRQTGHFAWPEQGLVSDRPCHAWRGMHLDVSRQVYSRQAILDFLDILAWHRLNRFHWHLTDDEGWRLESRTYPRLTEIGAFRGHGLPLLPQHGSGPEPHGGFFSIEDVKEILDHARKLHIEIIPEVDVPGHCHAALMAVPELLDPGAVNGGPSVQGYVNNALNPGLMATWTFLETIFAEVTDLFPGPYIHVGGDEVAKGAWDGSRSARSWARAKGLVDEHGAPDAMQMQAAMLRFVQARLSQAGKVTLGWEEAARGGGLDPDKTILMAWMHAKSGPELARLGYRVVMTPGEVYYLDMAQSETWTEPGLSWAGTSSPEQTYCFGPLVGFDDNRDRVIGLQGCIWSENLVSRSLFNHMVFPRLSAIAENAWTKEAEQKQESFRLRVTLMPQGL